MADNENEYDDKLENEEEIENEDENEEENEDEEEEIDFEDESIIQLLKTVVSLKIVIYRLKKMTKKMQTKQTPFLNPIDKRTYQQAKSYVKIKFHDYDDVKGKKQLIKDIQDTINEKLKPELEEFEDERKEAWKRFWAKVKTLLTSALPLVLIFSLIVFVGACFASIMSMIFSNQSDGDDKTMSTQFGVNGADFYGNRVVYRDSDSARVEIITNVADLVDNVVNDLESTTIENATIDVIINLPTEEFDWKNLDETAYQTDYLMHYNLVKSMLEIVYERDKIDETITPTTLTEYADNIAHFGFSTDMIEPIKAKIIEYLSADGIVLVVPDEDGGEIPSVDTATIINNSVNKIITNASAVQTEKYFIKDYLFSAEDDMMKDIAQENYVAMIFMPKNEVTFNSFSFLVNDIDDNFSIKLYNNGQELSLDKSEFLEEDGEVTWEYSSNDNLNIDANVYQYKGNLNLSQAMSLYSIAKESADSTNYLQTAEDSAILTYSANGVYLVFDSNKEFLFCEWETFWE